MKKKVLIVDDDKIMRKIEKEIIEVINALEVFEATNGKDAFNLLQEKSFDLLITDVCMPEMSGIELVDKLRASGISIPILVLSGTSSQHIRNHLKSQKLIQFIEKPFSIDRLANTIQNLVN